MTPGAMTLRSVSFIFTFLPLISVVYIFCMLSACCRRISFELTFIFHVLSQLLRYTESPTKLHLTHLHDALRQAIRVGAADQIVVS